MLCPIALLIQEDVFYDWVNPLYLDVLNQSEIQERFTDDSEIQLENFIEVGTALTKSGVFPPLPPKTHPQFAGRFFNIVGGSRNSNPLSNQAIKNKQVC